MSVRRVDTSQFVGVSEIAEKAHVSRQAVTNWQTRHEAFPAPLVELECGPVYYWPDVKQWLLETGRLA